ncbi:MAG: TIGR00282 family metallophosphoesterase [Caldisericia bacterium]|nr:TIGR00282 family metallophosphoesterase [Caldisericia bacterium]
MPNKILKILFLGDIVGRLGRTGVIKFLHEHKKEYDYVIANCENASGGKGITKKNAAELLDGGVDFFTSGNHIWRKKEIVHSLDEYSIIRPLNYPPQTPGSGSIVKTINKDVKIGIINILGRVFMGNPIDCPFRTIEEELEKMKEITPIIFVDFHTETTSEKLAMGYFLDGKISCLVGTHTHIQTNDARILPEGTGYISDAGMCGPYQSVLGVKSDIIIETYLTQRPTFFEIESAGETIISYVSVEIDTETGKTTSINGNYVVYKA